MEAMGDILKRAREVLEATPKQQPEEYWMRESDYARLVREKIRESLHVTSKCPYGICDGSGILFDKTTNDTRACKCRRGLLQKKRLLFAEIPDAFAAFKVNDFRTDIYTDEEDRQLAYNAKKIAINYIKNFETIYPTGKGLYFYSETRGSGKTRLMAALGNALIQVCDKAVRFMTTSRLLDEIKATFERKEGDGGESYSDFLTSLKGIDILILDDLGVERPTPWVNEIFYGLLNDRMVAKKITLFTSNCKIEDLAYDSRIVDRLLRMAMPVKFPAESIRQKLAREENDQLIQQLLG